MAATANQSLHKINQRHGFSLVSSGSAGADLWENGSVRLRVTMPVAAEELEIHCELFFPNQKELLPLILPGEEAPFRIRVLDDQISVSQVFTSQTAYQSYIEAAANTAGLIKSQPWQNSQADLLPLPLDADEPTSIGSGDLEPFRHALRTFRAVQVQASYEILLAHVRASGVRHVLEIHPALLCASGDPRKLLDLITQLSPCNGFIFLLNSGLCDNDDRLRRAVLAFAARLNLMPACAGARFLLFNPGRVRSEEPVPTLFLADRGAQAVQRQLQRSGLTMSGANLAAIRGFQRQGQEVAASIEWLRQNERQGSAEAVHGANRLRYLGEDAPARKPEEFVRLHQFAAELLARRVIGHGEILRTLAHTLALWFWFEPDKPLVLAFVGPSGSGKNHILEVIAEILQEYYRLLAPHLVLYNCGVAADDKLWHLTGVGIGHVGAEKPGLLETLKNGSVFCADELDKNKSPLSDVQPFLVQLLDDGFLRNGHGRLVRVPNCVIALTMNAGAEAHSENWRRIGFDGKEPRTSELVKGHYRDYFTTHIHPALQGRIDLTFYLAHLTDQDRFELARRELEKTRKELNALGIPDSPDDDRALAKEIAAESDPSLGARAIKQAIREYRTKRISSLCNQPHTTSSDHARTTSAATAS